MLDGEYGIEGVCLALPTVVGSEGVEKIIEIELNEKELSDLKHSADTLKNLAKEIGY